MINRFTLDNGLIVVHEEVKTTPLVAVNTLYNVGSKDEDPEHTGFAHLFEHLMFGGSLNAPSFDDPIQLAGGENNAFTCVDYTNYYDVVPCQNIETALWLESDRMLSLNFSQKTLDVQKSVVCEEFKQRNLNQPYGDASHLINSLVYTVHPYSWPTIGKKIEHIQNVDIDIEKEFFYSHYAPNNAILSIVGNISLEKLKSLIEKWFGDIPFRNIKPRNIPQEPLQKEARELTVERDVPQNALFRTYRSPKRTDFNFYTTDVISDILSNGSSSRLYQSLVKEQEIFSAIDAYVSGNIEDGLFFIKGKLNDNISYEKAESAIDEQINILKTEYVTENELNKVRNKYESTQLFGNLNLSDRAHNLAYFQLLGNVYDIEKDVINYNKVSFEDIKNIANTIFKAENCSTIYYKSKK